MSHQPDTRRQGSFDRLTVAQQWLRRVAISLNISGVCSAPEKVDCGDIVSHAVSHKIIITEQKKTVKKNKKKKRWLYVTLRFPLFHSVQLETKQSFHGAERTAV